MMTIKQFANLCRCNTQTLRYYDRIGLMKPASVDKWSGYRYYDAAQALDFVKIRNLQQADFSIEEIRALLGKSDQEIYEAFNRKIDEQREKLERIQKIQQSYLREKSIMEKLIQEMTDHLLGMVDRGCGVQEFGITNEEGERIEAVVRAYMEEALTDNAGEEEDVRVMINDEVVTDAEQALERLRELSLHEQDEIVMTRGEESHQEFLRAEGYAPIWEAHGWQYVHEFIGGVPVLTEDGHYKLFFLLNDAKHDVAVTIAIYMIGLMVGRADHKVWIEGCSAEKSDDGLNHFRLLKRQEVIIE